jgi:CBS domain-containing protein
MRTQLVTAKPADSVAAAIGKMNDAGIGAILVCSDAVLVGIFTERDVLRLAEACVAFDHLPIRDVMTPRPVTATPDDTIVAVAELMRDKKIRHVPVVEGDFVHGIVSVRDILAFLMERQWRDHDETAHDTAQTLLKR